MEEYLLENLDCADCSYKIENGLRKMKGVKFASVNFATSRLLIDADNMDEVISRIKYIEPDVRVKKVKNNIDIDKTGFLKEMIAGDKAYQNILFLLLPIILFIIAFIFKKSNFLILKVYDFTINVSDMLFISAYLLSGWKVLKNAITNIIHLQFFDENFLMSIATIGAFFIDAIAEAAGVMIFYRVGEYFQDEALNKSRKSINYLLSIQPKFANLLKGKELIRIHLENVKIGDVVLVKPGEKVPLDGVVIDGKSQVDNSPITGESKPQVIYKGDRVYAGSINQSGVIKVRVEKLYRDSSISKILYLVENALEKKSRSEKFITRFSKYYTPVVVFGVVLVALVPPFVFGAGNFEDWLYRALVMLVISCPCAFVISIPLSYFGGIGKSSRIGVLIKGSNYLDLLAKARVYVFDKTGTLTQGDFKVVEVHPVNGYDREFLLKWVKIAESLSDHPIAKSIVEFGGRVDISDKSIESYKEIKGKGIKALINGKKVICGNERLFNEEGIAFEKCKKAGSVVYVSVNNSYIGYILISDTLKTEAKKVIKVLRELGIKRIGMLTGDRHEIAADIKNRLGLDFCYSELLPEDKVKIFERIKEENPEYTSVFVGDGINDAPVIARADIGIAMGAYGTDAAIEAADVVLMSDSLDKIPESIKIAKKTKKIVLQNIVLSLSVKVIFLLLGGLGMATMWEAVFGDVGVSLIAIFNAVRILY